MACQDCEERRKRLRDAILHGKMAKAMDITVEGLRVMIGIDSAADHRKDAAKSPDIATSHVVGRAGVEWAPVADDPAAKRSKRVR